MCYWISIKISKQISLKNLLHDLLREQMVTYPEAKAMLVMYWRCLLLETGCSVYAFLCMCFPPFFIYIPSGFFYRSDSILVSILDISLFPRGVIHHRSLSCKGFVTCDSCNIYRSQSLFVAYYLNSGYLQVFFLPVDRKDRHTLFVLLRVPLQSLINITVESELPILPLFL